MGKNIGDVYYSTRINHTELEYTDSIGFDNTDSVLLLMLFITNYLSPIVHVSWFLSRPAEVQPRMLHGILMEAHKLPESLQPKFIGALVQCAVAWRAPLVSNFNLSIFNRVSESRQSMILIIVKVFQRVSQPSRPRLIFIIPFLTTSVPNLSSRPETDGG